VKRWISGTEATSLARNRRASDQIGDSPRRIRPHLREDGNHENANKKQKARSNVRAFASQMAGILKPWGCNVDDLLVLLGLLFRGRQAFETLQELFLGHALDGNFGIVGIDAGTSRPDQRHRIGLRLVDLDEFLQ
jgi:hypothetical protein